VTLSLSWYHAELVEARAIEASDERNVLGARRAVVLSLAKGD
jgi:hypothetical protein